MSPSASFLRCFVIGAFFGWDVVALGVGYWWLCDCALD